MSSSSSSERDRRIQTDMSELMTKDFQVKLVNDSKLDQLEVVFHGPKESPYEDGVWKIHVDIPPDYPVKPPKLKFVNTIFHPNISQCGFVCVNLLSDGWDPSYDLVKIFEEIIPQLLLNPNPEDRPNNVDASDLLNESKEGFEQSVREHCAEYAKKEDIQSESSSGEEGSRSSQDRSP